MLRAVIFDFNGVIVDDEPIHQETFCRVLAEEGIYLSAEEYHEKYLALDDRSCFQAILQVNRRETSDPDMEELIRRKAAYYAEAIRQKLTFFPGVLDLIPQTAQRYRLAIASGAARREIEQILNRGNVRQYFEVIVSAEDFSEPKPNPEVFVKTLALLNRSNPDSSPPLSAEECLVIEDSVAGVEAARSAGMRCLAVSNSYPRERLAEANLVVPSLMGIDLDRLESLFLVERRKKP
ncbi:MAG: HAD family phosphatase [Candidatus Tectomicrobia bacterium]|uniref:HAD family phosphatase n=1 Tax=Tectimicrobiota bacterium TaxID=2528274 RepID=A0A932GM58_UNCTE|nr:HAD family phosphatase [Candidatus Tectomicrobia bacterium]